MAGLDRRPADERQWAIGACLTDNVPPLSKLDFDELRALKWAVTWLEGTAPGLPTVSAIDDRLAVYAILDPLRELAREPFLGRKAQLTELRSRADQEPVLVHGFGGVGKSGLVARYLLDIAEDDPSAVVCYLSLEHSGLDFDRPASLVAALARQLAVQVHGRARDEINEVVARAQDAARTGEEGVKSSSRSSSRKMARAQLSSLLRLMTDALDGVRCFVGLDTVESVQRRGSLALEYLCLVVARLNRVSTVVLAGRAPAPELHVPELRLDGLDRRDAIALLRRLRGPRMLSVATADRVVEQVGSTPLCLRLAAGILAKPAGDKSLQDLALRRGAIAGELYERILGHIADPDVRRLAHPGLTVRRVTPDVIRHVLAGPCGVDVPDEVVAHRLFTALASEAMLVEQGPGGVIVHRADVRQLMLRPLAEDNPDTVRQIHEAAVTYYADRPGGQDRAEELYHRLMLAQPPRVLDARWDHRAVPFLVDSFDELPAVSQAYLAARSGAVAVPPDVAELAEVSIREGLVRRRVDDLIARADYDRAILEVDRFGAFSLVLADLKVQAQEFQGDFTGAFRTAEEARRRSARVGTPSDFLMYTLHTVRLMERMGLLRAADDRLADTLTQANPLPDTDEYRTWRLRLVVYRLRIARQQGTSRELLVEEALDLYEELPLRAITGVPGLIRDLAAEVGERSTKLLSTALRAVGLPNVSHEDAHELGEVLARLDNSTPGPLLPADTPGGTSEEWTEWVLRQTRETRGMNVANIMGNASGRLTIGDTNVIAGHYQTEADAAIHDDGGDMP